MRLHSGGATELERCLERVCKNPRRPQFNHYLFEATAVLVRAACGPNPAMTTEFEQLLSLRFRLFWRWTCRSFRLMSFRSWLAAQYRPDGLSDAYRALFQPLLAPANWDRKGNCPALVRLLQAYLKQGAAEILPHLQGMLGCFQKLLALKSTEGNAFALLESILVHVPMESLQALPPSAIPVAYDEAAAEPDGPFLQASCSFPLHVRGQTWARRHGAV